MFGTYHIWLTQSQHKLGKKRKKVRESEKKKKTSGYTAKKLNI